MRISTPALLLLLSTALLAADDAPPAPTVATVVSVYDGDTFTLSTGDKVRVSGVNTPELRPKEAFGYEARDATRAFVQDQEVRLEYGAVQRDGYGRLVAYVRVDGQPLEAHIISQGLGHVFLIPPVEVADVDALLAAQARAREAGLGIWSTPNYQGVFHFTSFHANGKGDDELFPNGEYLRVCNITEQPQSTRGFSITNAQGQRFVLPDAVIPPGHTFKLLSGKGQHQLDPAEQIELYLGSDTPIWNNGYDLATLYDARGEVVDFRDHKVKNPTR